MIEVPNFDSLNILVYGDLMLDHYWIGETRRISPEAPVPVVRVNQKKTSLGGAGNVALNLAALGVKVNLFGWIGCDRKGEELKQLLESHHIEHNLLELESYTTISKLRVIGQNQQLIRLDFESNPQSYDDSKLIAAFKEKLEQTDLIILSDYAKGVLHLSSSLINLAREKNIPILVDPKSNDFSRYAGATIITPNKREFEEVVGPCVGESDMIEKAQILLSQYNFNGILITQGSQGMLLVMQNLPPVKLSARAREVYDVTGAGDTVIAVLSAAFAAGLKYADAAYLANVAAGMVVRKLGTSSVTVPELRRELQKCYNTDLGVMSDDKLLEVVADARHHGEKIVMTNGCFDLLHAGHIQYLEAAKALGDRLIIAVNSDDSVTRLKGKDRPLNALAARMAVLSALRSVDWVVSFSEDTPENLIKKIMPDVLVKGADYQIEQIAGAEAVLNNGGEVLTIAIKEGYSTSHIIEKISKTVTLQNKEKDSVTA